MSASSLTWIGSVYLTKIARMRMSGRRKSGRISLPPIPVSGDLYPYPNTPCPSYATNTYPPWWVDYTLWDFKNPNPLSEKDLDDQSVPGFKTYTPEADFTELTDSDNLLSPRVSCPKSSQYSNIQISPIVYADTWDQYCLLVWSAGVPRQGRESRVIPKLPRQWRPGRKREN